MITCSYTSVNQIKGHQRTDFSLPTIPEDKAIPLAVLYLTENKQTSYREVILKNANMILSHLLMCFLNNYYFKILRIPFLVFTLLF